MGEQQNDGQEAVVKIKGNSEEYYLEKHPDTGLVTGTLILVDPTAYPEVGSELPNGEELTEADLVQMRRIVTKTPKKLMQRACADSGEVFWLATSDVHQCFFAPEVREAKRKERQKEKRKDKRDAEKARIAELEAENATLKEQAGD